MIQISELYTPEELDIYDEGFKDAKKGSRVEDNPYEKDSREYKIWDMGYYDYFYE